MSNDLGKCPKCHKTKIYRPRTETGKTQCISCGFTLDNDAWNDQVLGKDTEPKWVDGKIEVRDTYVLFRYGLFPFMNCWPAVRKNTEGQYEPKDIHGFVDPIRVMTKEEGLKLRDELNQLTQAKRQAQEALDDEFEAKVRALVPEWTRS